MYIEDRIKQVSDSGFWFARFVENNNVAITPDGQITIEGQKIKISAFKKELLVDHRAEVNTFRTEALLDKKFNFKVHIPCKEVLLCEFEKWYYWSTKKNGTK